MTDKPTDEIERRAEECLNSIEPKYIPGDVDEYLYSEESMKAMFAFGHSAAKEEVELLRAALHERETECVLKTDRIGKLEAENQLKSASIFHLEKELDGLRVEPISRGVDKGELLAILREHGGHQLADRIEREGIK